MYRDLSDEKLVELAVASDPDAFGEIVRRWDRKIFALCFGMLTREDEARQETLQAFSSSSPGFDTSTRSPAEIPSSTWIDFTEPMYGIRSGSARDPSSFWARK